MIASPELEGEIGLTHIMAFDRLKKTMIMRTGTSKEGKTADEPRDYLPSYSPTPCYATNPRGCTLQSYALAEKEHS
jgi:hypothetical protein